MFNQEFLTQPKSLMWEDKIKICIFRYAKAESLLTTYESFLKNLLENTVQEDKEWIQDEWDIGTMKGK